MRALTCHVDRGPLRVTEVAELAREPGAAAKLQLIVVR